MWKGGSLLQHGSIILEPQHATWADLITKNHDSKQGIYSELESRTASLLELLGYRVETDQIIAAIEKGMSLILGVTFASGPLSPEEWSLARKIVQSDLECKRKP